MIKKHAFPIANSVGYTATAVYLGCAALTVIIFYLDLIFPRGVAIGSLYIVVVLLAIWSPGTRMIMIAALITSLLVLIVLLFKPPAEAPWKSIFNRGLALVIIWITAILGAKIKKAEQELIKIASHDFLTGLLNRREMYNRMHTEICRVDRVDKPFSILIIDIDYFKRINDRYGHVTGDRVLKEMSAMLKEHLREYDYVCRYGGEEFLVAAPETPLADAHELADRLRREVEAKPFAIPAQPAIPVTISVGVTQLVKGEQIEATLSRADKALYQAKESGRNRVVVA
ncbi:GGDEF domain-containing protein [Pelotalea chapellei]|uniref:diguanylate cyclase n=1 Tax=Pelotalea chapellei TaxID=44671 RepID=A0ABS5U4L5_9BACT|nr:GGDEF domain-containing protein [Pelotalea chapellei]MBT1070584.1 GGDEF domain-containing protein [Pelotalea chapellei]